MKRFTRYRRIKIRKRKKKQRQPIRKQKGGFLDFSYLAKSLAQKRPPPTRWLYKALENYV